MALLCETIDIDLDDLQEVFVNAKETIAYLQDVVQGIEKRVLEGEKVDGLKVVEGRKTRTITDEGLKYLEKTLGKDNVYETVFKPIGVTKLEKMLEPDDFAELYQKGIIAFKVGNSKVVATKK